MAPSQSRPGWPITIDDIISAEQRIRPHLTPTPLRNYPVLDRVIGSDIRVLVKHENHQPTNSFKVRNGLAAVSALSNEQRAVGVIAATRGNHGQGVAFAGKRFGIPVTICVPENNSKSKNQAMRALGATLVEKGRDYDESVAVAQQLVEEQGLQWIHSTNDPTVIAGAGTIGLEMFAGGRSIDAVVVAVGGGSQAVGTLTVVRALAPHVEVYGVQAERASTCHDSWHAKKAVSTGRCDTFADGLATRSTYALTFRALVDGLRDFVTVSEAELADAIRLYARCTGNLAEGAGAAGLAGVRKLAPRLVGKTIAVVLSGGNIDEDVLQRIFNRDL